MMTRTSTLILTMVALAGCGRDETRRSPSPRSVAARPDLSSASQADLASELEQAEQQGTWSEVRARWQGQQLSWTVIRHKALCSSAMACNVAAFPVQRPARHGWMPGLSFAPGEFAKLEAACGDADPCAVKMAGTLDRLALSAEQPVSLRFAQVRIVL